MSDEFDDEEDRAPGWESIDSALDELYNNEEPMHWGTVLPYNLGGEDPLYGVSVYHSEHEEPHLHYITYGFSDLYEKENDDPEWSGFGFELTFRLAAPAGAEPEVWVVNFLQNLARYVFETGNGFGPGHTIPLNSPICLETETLIRSVTFVEDPELKTIDTPHGQVRFLQVVGITNDELDATQCWNAQRLTELMQMTNPLLVTDVNRQSYLTNEDFAAQVDQFSKEEGASAAVMCSDEFRIMQDPQTSQVTLVLGAIVASGLGKRLVGRIPFDREFRLVGDEDEILFQPGDDFHITISDHQTVICFSDEQVKEVASKMAEKSGSWEFENPAQLKLVIEKTVIKDQDGNVTDVLG